MAIEYSDKTLRQFLEMDRNAKLVLPNFQRDFVWRPEQQANLIASLLAGIPFGSVLLISGQAGEYSARSLCLQDTATPQSECYYLLDGQQRLSAFKSCLSNVLSAAPWKTAWDSLYSKLRNRWLLKLEPGESVSQDDIFGLRTLHFNRSAGWEPSEWRPFIECRSIPAGKKDFVHPAYAPEENGKVLSGEALALKVARECASHRLVPLWDLYDNPEQGLHYRTLRLIARLRAEELEAASKDGNTNAADILRNVRPDIDTLIEEGRKEEIRDAWNELWAKWVQDITTFLEQKLSLEKVPYISVPANEMQKGIAIFETVNKGGTPLSVFDLIVAKAARISPDPLPARIAGLLSETRAIDDPLWSRCLGKRPASWSAACMGAVEDNAPSASVRNAFLNLLSIWSHRAKEGSLDKLKVENIKRGHILDLRPEDIEAHAQPAARALWRALAFFQFRCGIVSESQLRYKLMLLPVAVSLADDANWSSTVALNKVEYWYWSSLFGGSYREAQNEQCVRDVKELLAWARGGSNPFTDREKIVFSVPGYSDVGRLLVDNDAVGADVGDVVPSYVLSRQPRDFVDNSRLAAWDVSGSGSAETLEDHHIIPLSDATTVGESTRNLRGKAHVLNGGLNRTYIFGKTNRALSDRALVSYMPVVSAAAQHGHCIPQAPISLIREASESVDAYYRRVLTARFNTLRTTLTQELLELTAE